jgi:type III pantothenate kinase
MTRSVVAVDIGNSRIKLGLFDIELLTLETKLKELDENVKELRSRLGKPVPANVTGPRFEAPPPEAKTLPIPQTTLALASQDWDERLLRDWLTSVPAGTEWWIVSVNRPATARLVESIRSIAQAVTLRMLSHSDLPIAVAIKEPDRVGIDRLAAAAAANRLRDPGRAAIVVHVGTAIVVDLLNADGQFCGGAILPGIAMSARALHEFTDLLPKSSMQDLEEPPTPLGTSSLEAIHSGLYWGAIGAMRELATKLSVSPAASGAKADIFLTGGAAPSVASQLGPDVRYVEHLVLSGIALAANLGDT